MKYQNFSEAESVLSPIIERFDTDQKQIKETQYSVEYDSNYLFPRLNRAALNQGTEGKAQFGRYAAWAETAADILGEAVNELYKDESNRKTREHLLHVLNSLHAFAEIQHLFDPPDHDI